MGSKTSITVTESTLERFNAAKAAEREDGVPEMSADQFVNALLDTLEAVDSGYYEDGADATGDVEVLIPDRVENSIKTIENRTGRLERLIEEMQGR